MISPKHTPIKDILLFIGGAATGLLGALIVSSEGNDESVREVECEEEVEESEEEGKEVDKEGINQPVGAE